MRTVLCVAAVLAFAACAPAHAACQGSIAGGFTLSAPTTYYYRNGATCALIQGGTATFSPAGFATAVVGTAAGLWVLTPIANGTATLTVSSPGFAPLSIPVTVSLGVADWDSQ
jgi:hypothetical protein